MTGLMKRDFQQLPSQATPMPYAVSSLSDLPGSLQEAARHYLSPADRLVSIYVFPGRTHLKDMYRWENVSEQALLFTDTAVQHIQAPASSDQPARLPERRSLRATDLLYTRLSLILMYGRLELVDKNLTRLAVDFNAAGFNIIQPGLQQLLETACARDSFASPDGDLTKKHLESLGELSYKFKNGLHLYGLLPGEQLLGFVFQPALWMRRWKLFPRKKSETTLLALTNKQLIVVEERASSRFPAYGWILTFHPRHAIKKIELAFKQPWHELAIGLKGSAGLNNDQRLALEAPNALVWQELWSRFGDNRAAP